MTELTVNIKGETESGEPSNYKQKFLLYEDFSWSENDPLIKKCVEETLANTKIQPDEIKVRALIQFM